MQRPGARSFWPIPEAAPGRSFGIIYNLSRTGNRLATIPRVSGGVPPGIYA